MRDSPESVTAGRCAGRNAIQSSRDFRKGLLVKSRVPSGTAKKHVSQVATIKTQLSEICRNLPFDKSIKKRAKV